MRWGGVGFWGWLRVVVLTHPSLAAVLAPRPSRFWRPRGAARGGAQRDSPLPERFGGGTKALRCCFQTERGENGAEDRKWGAAGGSGAEGRCHGTQPVPLAAAARPPTLAICFAGPGEEAKGTDAVPGQGQEEDPLPLPAPAAIQVPPEAPLQLLLPSAAEGETR